MKLLGILWNSIGDKKDDAIKLINEYANVDYRFDVDFKDDYAEFIRELYPFNSDEKWKAEYKINGLVGKYINNEITILFLDMEKTDKIYLKNKDKMMYKNVLDLKVRLRKSFKSCILKDTQDFKGVSYDNVFHMTDDEEEYRENIFVVFKYLSKYAKRDNGCLVLDDYIQKDSVIPEKWGTRNKFWINNNLLYKENTDRTYECYSEIFNMHLMKNCGLNAPYYDLAKHDNKVGVITWNVFQHNEFAIDGSHMMSEDESFTKKELIEHNNIECLSQMIPAWCNEKNIVYNCQLIQDLEKLYIYDLLSLQPDRNPSNYAYAIDKDTRQVRLVFFDNANMYFCDDAFAIQMYKNKDFDPLKYIDKMKTFLLYKNTDTCFDAKEKLFVEYYNSVDSDKRLFVDFLLEQMSQQNLKKIFQNIEYEYSFKLPNDFKNGLLESYRLYQQKLLDSLKLSKNKKLTLK